MLTRRRALRGTLPLACLFLLFSFSALGKLWGIGPAGHTTVTQRTGPRVATPQNDTMDENEEQHRFARPDYELRVSTPHRTQATPLLRNAPVHV